MNLFSEVGKKMLRVKETGRLGLKLTRQEIC